MHNIQRLNKRFLFARFQDMVQLYDFMEFMFNLELSKRIEIKLNFSNFDSIFDEFEHWNPSQVATESTIDI